MSQSDAWALWWAQAWKYAHLGWGDDGLAPCPPEHLQALARSQHIDLGKRFSIDPCLPISPTPALLYLTLVRSSQQDLMLTLIDNTCRPMLPTQLNTEQQIWCERLGKALRPHTWLEDRDDTLQLLRAWVEPPVWQRLRLRFECSRVMALEQIPAIPISQTKLQTLWQAVVWRTKAITEAHDNAIATQDSTSA